jgi:DNA modification methylase
MKKTTNEAVKDKKPQSEAPKTESKITDTYALYNCDCIELMESMPPDCVGMSISSPPFAGLFLYSSDPRDMSNCKDYQEFFEHYRFSAKALFRIMMPGRIVAIHCMDVPGSGVGETAKMGVGANVGTGLIDFPGDIIRLYYECGFAYCGRRAIWKEPLGVRMRTMAKGLAHAQIVEDSTLCDVASADYLLMFRKKGENKIPVAHPEGLTRYAGERAMPHELQQFKNFKGKQTENRFSHWIWRQYASSFWDDIRIGNVLPYEESRDTDDEKHVHPLQLDVIERAVILWSNERETVFTPYMGVGSEVFGAVINNRRGMGSELKATYYKQAVKNLAKASECTHEQELIK